MNRREDLSVACRGLTDFKGQASPVEIGLI